MEKEILTISMWQMQILIVFLLVIGYILGMRNKKQKQEKYNNFVNKLDCPNGTGDMRVCQKCGKFPTICQCK